MVNHLRAFAVEWADVRALAGDANGWGRWLGTSRPTRLVLHTAALLPDARSSSTAMSLVAWGLRRGLDQGFEQFVFAVVVEGFLSRTSGQTREYALYGRPIG